MIKKLVSCTVLLAYVKNVNIMYIDVQLNK